MVHCAHCCTFPKTGGHGEDHNEDDKEHNEDKEHKELWEQHRGRRGEERSRESEIA